MGRNEAHSEFKPSKVLLQLRINTFSLKILPNPKEEKANRRLRLTLMSLASNVAPSQGYKDKILDCFTAATAN
ncbi:hypothetical protein R3W88_014339 [Solanum pinnatisectum]|uniref:Uncharacterized protein n=1 Tax=Solanum pinnatisectum TaxID=50273 RepID=A0AAV9KRT0_9SOLN|nr:hypothetical protein R3W88_014339 [Solanum pinnatisectum]